MLTGPPPKFHGTRDNLAFVGVEGSDCLIGCRVKNLEYLLSLDASGDRGRSRGFAEKSGDLFGGIRIGNDLVAVGEGEGRR